VTDNKSLFYISLLNKRKYKYADLARLSFEELDLLGQEIEARILMLNASIEHGERSPDHENCLATLRSSRIQRQYCHFFLKAVSREISKRKRSVSRIFVELVGQRFGQETVDELMNLAYSTSNACS
jgi:hypothetical protein